MQLSGMITNILVLSLTELLGTTFKLKYDTWGMSFLSLLIMIVVHGVFNDLFVNKVFSWV